MKAHFTVALEMLDAKAIIVYSSYSHINMHKNPGLSLPESSHVHAPLAGEEAEKKWLSDGLGPFTF